MFRGLTFYVAERGASKQTGPGFAFSRRRLAHDCQNVRWTVMLIRLVLLQLGGIDIHERPDATLGMLTRSVRFERFPCGYGFSVHQQSLQVAGDGLLSRFDRFLKRIAGR